METRQFLDFSPVAQLSSLTASKMDKTLQTHHIGHVKAIHCLSAWELRYFCFVN